MYHIPDPTESEDFIEDGIKPQHILRLNDESVNLTAFLVIDNPEIGLPSGGVRMTPDVTLHEITRLARAMSLKCVSFQIPSGGGKAGIIGDQNSENRDLLITAFGDMISPYIKQDLYYPGTDMGTTYSDLEKIFKAANVKLWLNENIKLERSGQTINDHFTGYGVVFCLDTLYHGIKSLKSQVNTPKVMLEGFGKVGKSAALCLRELGYKLCGLSTIRGAIFDEDGLDLDALLKLKNQYGDDLVNQYQSKNLVKVEKEKFFELSSEYPIDFLIPGARPDAIHKNNINKIDAKAIVPAANIPYASGMVDILDEKGIIAFPDFIANAGATVFLSRVNFQSNYDELFSLMKGELVNKTNELLKEASLHKSPIYNIARTKAVDELKKYIMQRRRKLVRLNRKSQSVIQSPSLAPPTSH